MPDIDTAELRKIASAQQVYVWIDAVNAAADTIDRLRAQHLDDRALIQHLRDDTDHFRSRMHELYQEISDASDAASDADSLIDRLRADLAAAERRGAEKVLTDAARAARSELGRKSGIIDIGDEAGRWLDARAAALGGTATEAQPECICTRFGDTGGFRIADLACPVHGPGGTEPGDGYWEPPTETSAVTVVLRGGPWAGEAEIDHVTAPVFAAGDPIGGHYWLDTKSDPPTYHWDGAEWPS